MISREQCRAARGLLGWTQQDLADAAGLSKTAINNFERGLSSIKNETLQAIGNAFTNAHIEMLAQDGVRKRTEAVQILKGPHALPALWDDIFESLKKTGGEVLINNVNERWSYDAHPDALDAHLDRLRRFNITERLLACEGDDFFIQPVHYYRWISRDVFTFSMSSFIYGDKVALQLWKDAMILIIDSKEANEAEKQRFEYLWRSAKMPVLGKPEKAAAQ